MKKRAIYWFRDNLRLKDNPSLDTAIRECEEILPVYVVDERLFRNHPLGFRNCGDHRWSFLWECLIDLKTHLKSIGSDLLILFGNPTEKLSHLADENGIKHIYHSKAVDYNEIKQEESLSERFVLNSFMDQTLLQAATLPFEVSKLPFVFTEFRKAVEKSLDVRKELPSPTTIPTLKANFDQMPSVLPDVQEKDYRSAFPFPGGETQAWERLNQYFWKDKHLSRYKNTRNGMIGPNYSSKFSPYLATGSISPVSIFHQIKQYENEVVKNISTYWLVFELLWREFFKWESLKYGKKIFLKKGILGKDNSYQNDRLVFTKWIEGETADDFVNANMKELKYTGFMSNRGRQNVASYLVHDLQIDWRWGAAWFESQLIDYDCASNWCNWMYVAGIGNDPRSRKFNTKWQAEKYDTKGKYRNLWLQPSLF